MKKMNNKGFSLVELIVVVLIMAIIAVALAPQVMKWVENSRKSTDSSNYDTIYSAANIALGDETVLREVKGKSGITITATNSTRTWTVSDTSTTLDEKMEETLGNGWQEGLKAKASTLDSIDPSGNPQSEGYQITVTSAGHVERTKAPYNPNS